MNFFVCYLILVNIISFALMGRDKSLARKGKNRISEKALFLVAIVGGSVGSILGMQLFRHKTKHKSFVLGMPAILAAQLILLFVLKL